MAAIRRRVLNGGREHFDVAYHDNGRPRSATFATQDAAAEFAALYALRRRRWPLAPLLTATGLTAYQLVERHGLPPKTARRLTRLGVTDVTADHWAIAEGLHPSEVWGWDWVAAALPAADHTVDQAGAA